MASGRSDQPVMQAARRDAGSTFAAGSAVTSPKGFVSRVAGSLSRGHTIVVLAIAAWAAVGLLVVAAMGLFGA